ncbi:MAG: hypothetical protein JWO08_2804 [Verrucomicrobiaceae bacterium]|nr:hypothetical protein [Verrucomicrobiaceae bacterium]
MKSDSPSRSLLLPVLLVVAALAYRVAKLKFGMTDVIPNFGPWMALAFAGSMVMPRTFAWWVLPALFIACDRYIGSGHMGTMWTVYACYGIAAYAGSRLRKRSSVLLTLGGTAIGSLIFYIVTNTQAWYANPVYAKSMAGWLQALTVGDPLYPQTWIFGMKSMMGDLGFALLLVVAYNSEAIVRRLRALPVLSAPQVVAH